MAMSDGSRYRCRTRRGPVVSLIVTIETTDTRIDTLTATRVVGEGVEPDDMNLYRLERYTNSVQMPIAHITHRYGDGALALAQKMLAATLGEEARNG